MKRGIRMATAGCVVGLTSLGLGVRNAPAALVSVSIGNGTASPDGTYLNAGNVASTLAFTNVTVTATNNIDVVDSIDLSTSQFGPTFGDLILNAPTVNLNNNMVIGSGHVQFTGATTLNLTGEILNGGNPIGSSKVLNNSTLTQLNVLANTASIQQAVDISSATSPVTVNVATGQINQNVTIGKSLTLTSTNAGGNTNNANLKVGSSTTATLSGGGFNNATGGTMSGVGTFDVSGLGGGGFVNHGTVAPGSSPGVLSFTGAYNQAGDGDLEIEIGGTTVGTQYDRLAASGPATLGGLLHATLINGFVPSPSDTFTILTSSADSGAFSNATSMLTIPGGHFDVNYTPTAVTLSNFAVPEPDAACVLAIGAIGLMKRRRFGRMRSQRT